MAEIARADRKAFDLRHQRGFPTITVLCLVFLYAPIALLITPIMVNPTKFERSAALKT